MGAGRVCSECDLMYGGHGGYAAEGVITVCAKEDHNKILAPNKADWLTDWLSAKPNINTEIGDATLSTGWL